MITEKGVAKEISKRCDISPEKARQCVQAFEDIINEIIATNKAVQFDFGVIQGITKKPRKITGRGAKFGELKNHGGWTACRLGIPNIIWSKDAQYCTKIPPDEWFNYVENRYSEDAQKYREDNNLPLIDKETEDPLTITRMPEDIKELYESFDPKVDKILHKGTWTKKKKRLEISEWYAQQGIEFVEFDEWKKKQEEIKYEEMKRQIIEEYEAKKAKE